MREKKRVREEIKKRVGQSGVGGERRVWRGEETREWRGEKRVERKE